MQLASKLLKLGLSISLLSPVTGYKGSLVIIEFLMKGNYLLLIEIFRINFSQVWVFFCRIFPKCIKSSCNINIIDI